MPKVMRLTTIFSLAAAVTAGALFYYSAESIWLTLAITFATTFYHLAVRLLVGRLYNAGMRNRADYTKKWYQLRAWENKLYQFLRVKAWKNKMPAFYPETFSPQNHSWAEIAQAMCQSELVHETNMLLSFVPLIFARWFGAFYVFLITSAGGALFDLLFVIMQRYNRARVIKIASKRR